MSHISHSPPQDTYPLSQTPSGNDTAASEERHWQVAQQRVLLYVRSLNLPAQKTLELALESLRRAKNESTHSSGADVAATTMRALHELMAEQGIQPLERCLRQGADSASRALEITSMPPLNRESMVPEVIDRQPWFSFISSGFKRRRRGGRGIR